MKSIVFKFHIYLFTSLSATLLIILTGFLFLESSNFFIEFNPFYFLTNDNWDVSSEPFSFGIFNILLANFITAFVACVISSFIAFGVTLFICFYSNKSKDFLNWIIRILAGIPSVIYGFFALFTIVNLIEDIFSMSAGESVLAASIILSIMILPFFTSHMIESVNLTKDKFKKDSDALGVSIEFFIGKIIFKECFLASIAGFIIAFSRAVGETMAVMMVIGNTPLFPFLLSKAQTIPSLIALEMGMSQVGSSHYYALVASGFILLLFVFILNFILFFIERKNAKS